MRLSRLGVLALLSAAPALGAVLPATIDVPALRPAAAASAAAAAATGIGTTLSARTLPTAGMISLPPNPAAAAAAPLGTAAPAAALTHARRFHELLRSSVSPELRDDHKLALIHMIPDAHVLSAMKADSLETAIARAESSSLASLYQATRETPVFEGPSADEILAQSAVPTTLVVVPGLFSEFITNRSFEDVLAKSRGSRPAFVEQVAAANAALDPNAMDETFSFRDQVQKKIPLSDVMSVGSLDPAGKVRLVSMVSPELSLESFGDLRQDAAIFLRRLDKYLALTGPQNVVLIGYSRGAPLALEMLAQAKRDGWARLGSVKALTTLGGVIWGSALADDAMAPGNKGLIPVLLRALKDLSRELDPRSFRKTLSAYWSFARRMIRYAMSKLTFSALVRRVEGIFLGRPRQPKSGGANVWALLHMGRVFWREFGLRRLITDFSINVMRLQRLIDGVWQGTHELTSEARAEWWKNSVLPKEVLYLGIKGAMPDPSQGGFDAEVYKAALGYAPGSIDDKTLLNNHRQYSALRSVPNDSQVDLASADYLENAAKRLNPANAGLRTESLGIVGTTHWGLALPQVIPMRRGGINPFPREALLKALAATVVQDLRTRAQSVRN